jgi:hypothetical protein
MWDEDKTVGIWPYVDGCKHPLGSRVFDDIEGSKDFRCSFFIERHEPECEKVRCRVCGSQKTTTKDYDGDNDTIIIECLDCGTERTVSVFDMPFGGR